MKKILVTGAHSTGKTTAIDAVGYDSFPNTVVVADCARTSPFPIGREQTEAISAWLVVTQIRNELSAQIEGSRRVVCDRGTIDIAAHWLDLLDKPIDATDYANSIFSMAKNWAKTYDVVLLSSISPEKPVISDGVREPDDQYRRLIQNRIIRLLVKWKINYEMLPVSLADRKERIQEVLLD